VLLPEIEVHDDRVAVNREELGSMDFSPRGCTQTGGEPKYTLSRDKFI
jgi:hypothetical protein